MQSPPFFRGRPKSAEDENALQVGDAASSDPPDGGGSDGGGSDKVWLWVVMAIAGVLVVLSAGVAYLYATSQPVPRTLASGTSFKRPNPKPPSSSSRCGP
eukprot:1347641-Pyramimonas_sp.AAC.2